MTTENFELKVNDVIVGDTGFGRNMGYYIETKTDKHGVWVYYTNTKNKSRGLFTISIDKIRPATKEEIVEFEK